MIDERRSKIEPECAMQARLHPKVTTPRPARSETCHPPTFLVPGPLVFKQFHAVEVGDVACGPCSMVPVERDSRARAAAWCRACARAAGRREGRLSAAARRPAARPLPCTSASTAMPRRWPSLPSPAWYRWSRRSRPDRRRTRMVMCSRRRRAVSTVSAVAAKAPGV